MRLNSFQLTSRTQNVLWRCDFRNQTFIYGSRKPSVYFYQNRRHYGAGIVIKVVKHFARIRYLVLGTAVGAGITVKSKIDEWKESLRVFPDISKVKSVVNVEDWGKATQFVTKNISTASNEAKNRLTDITAPNMSPLINIKEQLIERWENARQAEAQGRSGIEMTNLANKQEEKAIYSDKQKRKIEDLEKTVRELERQNELIKRELYSKKNIKMRSEKKTLVEMYSEVLDELSNYGDGWRESDNLPRVVVVGDQSAGKTSVLEMLAQARIFPRGAGEMMTRSPVKVTLCEGPFHVAQLQGISKEYDLKNDKDLAELRRSIETKMVNSVARGKTVSKDVISLTVKGPGLQRMVLIDLPGIISTQTVDMASDTRDLIREMSQQFMNNPNAIILCIQDGSIDAERSNVTELVSRCDPTGKRTIFVLTKVDMAERTIVNPERIRQILSGKLFPMKALGYFAVVTGNGNKDDSIQNIKDYEQTYFANSKLFKSGIVRPDQITTGHLSKAVADCFWKMVEESIELQYDVFRAKKFNLETEWKNSFPRKQEMDRDELFYRARGEILDQGVGLSSVPASVWEKMLMDELWKTTSSYVFENIYFPAAMCNDDRKFNTLVDIALREWAEKMLPQRSLECANNTLKQLLNEQLFTEMSTENFDGVYENLKVYVFEEALKRHSWDERAMDILKVLQAKTLQDKYLTMRSEWDEAIAFLENSVKDTLKGVEKGFQTIVGPSYFQRLYRWQNLDENQQRNIALKNELELILNNSMNGRRSSNLSRDEVIAVKNNLGNKEINVDEKVIKDIWKLVHKRHFLHDSLERARACKKEFYLYSQEETRSQTDCNDVVLFWRIKQMLKMTSNALRQQITNAEAQNIQRTIREILKEVNTDDRLKNELIVGKRVALAEDLKRVRLLQEKLEDFVKKLKNDKK